MLTGVALLVIAVAVAIVWFSSHLVEDALEMANDLLDDLEFITDEYQRVVKELSGHDIAATVASLDRLHRRARSNKVRNEKRKGARKWRRLLGTERSHSDS